MKNNISRFKVEIRYAIRDILNKMNIHDVDYKILYLGEEKYDHTYKNETSYAIEFSKDLPLDIKVKNKLKIRYCRTLEQAFYLKLFLLNNGNYNINQPKFLWSYNNLIITEWIDGSFYDREDPNYLSKLKEIGKLHAQMEKNAVKLDDKNQSFLKKRLNNHFVHMENANQYFPFHYIIKEEEKEILKSRLDVFLKDLDGSCIVLSNYEWKREDIIFDSGEKPYLIDNESINFGLLGTTLWNNLNIRPYFKNKDEKDAYLQGFIEVFPECYELVKKHNELYAFLRVMQHGAQIENFVKTATNMDSEEEWEFVYKEVIAEQRTWMQRYI
ncbi:hypothetical protein [Bacillus pseudomycoides]|uniref:hypothetical protein n=1 Tax=Bacillus pseudomycoides TaxID=64104 RepID=UPI000BF342D3|nr:hypothetical protein [Bacillus pseudomycoides]PGD73712.1 hypothetical protein COM46_21785 [Bacillus pseudomycoides]